MLHLAQVTASETAKLLGQAHNILKGLAARPQVRALDPSRCDPLLADFLALAPRFANVVTMTLDGAVVCSAVPAARGARMNPDLFLKLLRGPGELTVGRISPGTITGRWVVPAGVPLLDAQGRTAGAVGLAIDLANFPVLPSLQRLPEGSVSGLMALDGTVLARSREAERFVGTRVGAGRPAQAGKSGTAELKGVDGILRIQGFTPVPGADWMAIASMPAAAVYAPVRESLWRAAPVLTGTLFAVFLLAGLLARRIAGPVRSLGEAARDVASGNLAARAPVTGGREMVAVAEEFNRMLDARDGAERALRQSEERFRMVFVGASVPMSIAAIGSERLLDVNDAFCRYFGYAREELLGRATVEMGLWVDPAERESITSRVLASGSVSGIETRRRLRSGEERDLVVNVDRLDLGGEPCTLAILIDVTEQRRAERERAAALARFEKIFHAAPLASAISTLAGGRLVEVNAAYCALVGRPREALIGRAVAELEIWSDPREREALIEQLRHERRVDSFEAHIRTAKGEARTMLTSAEPIEFFDEPCMITIGADITARIEAERALRESDARQRQVLDSMFPFVGLLSPEGRVLEVNRAPLDAAGLAREDVIGKLCAETYWFGYSAEGQKRLRRALARAAAGEAVRYDETIRVAGGRFVVIDLMFSPLRDASGEVMRIVGSAVDITERKRAEEALRESSARLEALTRRLLEVQESERRMVARELHDEVGGVLTAVKLNLQALARRRTAEADKAALADGLALVDGAIQSVRSLSLDLRPAVLDDLGLVPAIRWYCERQAERAGIPIELGLDAVDLKGTPQLESACFRIVQESVTNALRHAGARRIRVVLKKGATGLAMEISDDGRGFRAAEARVPGASSGLDGMAERASLNGGRLAIDSAPGAGTRVRADFSLPREAHA